MIEPENIDAAFARQQADAEVDPAIQQEIDTAASPVEGLARADIVLGIIARVDRAIDYATGQVSRANSHREFRETVFDLASDLMGQASALHVQLFFDEEHRPRAALPQAAASAGAPLLGATLERHRANLLAQLAIQDRSPERQAELLRRQGLLDVANDLIAVAEGAIEMAEGGNSSPPSVHPLHVRHGIVDCLEMVDRVIATTTSDP